MRCLIALTLALLFAHNASAAISYSTADSVYTESFNGVPAATNPLNIDPNTGNPVPVQYNASAHIQNGNTPWVGGWKDDSTSDATYLGIPGWYLWSDIATLTTANGGASAHAQFRYGGGASAGGTGFFVFSTTTCTTCGEKALGIRSASAFTDSNAGRRSYIGLQLINNTGGSLNSFTITYDGEQYSEAAGSTRDGFDLQWSLVASAAGWHDNPTSGGFYNNGVSGVDYGGIANSFESPVNNNPATATPTNTDPNYRIVDITHTISGINWAPGSELWIRWRDGDAHDGIGIDNVRFTASAAAVVPLAGDFNGDSKVDGADYVTWRENEVANATLPNDGGATDQVARYTLWRANFGNVPGAGGGSGLESSSVPEPSAIALVMLGLCTLSLKRERRASTLS